MAGEPTQATASRLLARHRPALLGYLLACVHNHADAEDLFQDVAVVVVRSLGRLRSEDEFLCWAREIARRRVLAHFRTAGRQRAVDPELVQRLAEAAERLEAVQPASERHEALRACLETLPERSRRLIGLRYDQPADGAEGLARLFGLSVQAVYALVKRIKSALRACVERRLAEEAEL
jgi:RNA polymerase sigma-70 factor (ECF subfamily)